MLNFLKEIIKQYKVVAMIKINDLIINLKKLNHFWDFQNNKHSLKIKIKTIIIFMQYTHFLD